MGLRLHAILDTNQRQSVECGMLAVVQWLGVAYAVHSVLQQTASVAEPITACGCRSRDCVQGRRSV